MFDDNHWWYTEMDRVQLKRRLSVLSLEQLVTYSVGCATHAYEAIRADVSSHELAEFQATATLLRLFWDDYPQTTSGMKLTTIAMRAEEAVASELGPEPDQKFLRVPGAEPLLWATLYALTLATNPTPLVPAYSAVCRSCLAVYARYAKDERAINEGRMHEVEKATRKCIAEIAFQMKYLELLEASPSLPSSYSEVATCSDRG